MASEPLAPIRVLIADDHPHFRRGLRVVLETAGRGIEVVGEAATGAEAIELAQRLYPDVVLLDLRMPEIDGITAAQAILDTAPGTRILMLTMSDSTEDIALATKAGVAGYLLKDQSLEDVIDAVRALADARTWPLAAS